MNPNDDEAQPTFLEEADQPEIGFLQEFWMFLSENKKWWMIPLIGSLLLIGLVSLVAATGAAPFIYTIF